MILDARRSDNLNLTTVNKLVLAPVSDFDRPHAGFVCPWSAPPEPPRKWAPESEC